EATSLRLLDGRCAWRPQTPPSRCPLVWRQEPVGPCSPHHRNERWHRNHRFRVSESRQSAFQSLALASSFSARFGLVRVRKGIYVAVHNKPNILLHHRTKRACEEPRNGAPC